MGNLARVLMLATILLAFITQTGAALQDSKNPPSVPKTGDRKSEDPTAGLEEQSTVDDILKALQRQRPQHGVIAPSRGEGRPAARRAKLLPEGTAVVDRDGSLVWSDPWWEFVSEPVDKIAPIKLLPNSTLNTMIRTATGSVSQIRFAISGESTVYYGNNYLLVRFAKRILSEKPAKEAGESDDPQTPDSAGSDSKSTPVVDSEKAPKQNRDDASVQDVLAALQSQKPTEDLVADFAEPDLGSPLADAALAGTLRAEGAPIVYRPGRLIRQGMWWVFSFESDHPDRLELPMKLLPNQNVELMAQATELGGRAPVFMVSGETTVFRGENYLLARATLLRGDTGNLRP